MLNNLVLWKSWKNLFWVRKKSLHVTTRLCNILKHDSSWKHLVMMTGWFLKYYWCYRLIVNSFLLFCNISFIVCDILWTFHFPCIQRPSQNISNNIIFYARKPHFTWKRWKYHNLNTLSSIIPLLYVCLRCFKMNSLNSLKYISKKSS